VKDVVIRPWPAGAWRRLLADALTDTDELLGFLPVAAEVEPEEGFTTDPVGELESPPDGGLLQKYHGRALLMVTGACAIHCRYCFRRHFPYAEHTVAGVWQETLRHLSDDRSISEVILSGGDPLTVPDDRLSTMVGELAALPHLRRLRIHTRLPIVLPERVDESLVEWLSEVRLPLIMVVHANHPAEIDGEVRRGLAMLGSTGITLLNQSVLLRGVNDNAGLLADLGETLFEAGVLPYYLHMLDPVVGAAHFQVAEEEALEIMTRLRRLLPGYLVPRLVREVAGAPSKVPVELQE